MQAISVSEARQNFKKYCDDVVENNDIIIVSRNGNGKENMVWIDLKAYNELQKAKQTLKKINSLLADIQRNGINSRIGKSEILKNRTRL